ncbi:MAG: DNA methyltransferase, partial [Janthinobacterium lividum]
MNAVRVERIGSATLYLGDCREVLPTLPAFSACITDPPYHGVKADGWDNQWRSDADFLAWVSGIADLIADDLASNGSLYWFASPQMAARVEVELRRLFVVRNLITWDKADGRKGIG